MGYSGTGTFTQSGGTNDLCGTYCYLYLGCNPGSSGSYILSGGSLFAGNEYVGASGSGTFTQTGGTNCATGPGNGSIFTASTLYVGSGTGGSGTYNLSGGSLYAPTQYIGYSSTGTFSQSGGTNGSYSAIYVGYNAGSVGTYILSDTGQVSSNYEEYVGYSGVGTFVQSGGTNSMTRLALGNYAGAGGAADLSGSGLLNVVYAEYVGNSGTGSFTQTGGTNAISYLITEVYPNYNLYVGCNPGSSGTYTLSGSGLLSVPNEFVAYAGSGNFTQSGGTNAVLQGLYVGGNGIYSLSGSGLLSAPIETVGASSTYTTTLFQQSGGTNTTSLFTIGTNATYQLTGGTLQVDTAWANGGVFDGGNSPGTLNANCLLDLTSGTWQNLGATSVNMGTNSLLIVPPGFNPSTGFGGYSFSGLPAHTLGTPLAVPAGQGFGGWGTIADPVTCQGTITAAPSGAINLLSGLVLSGTGNVSLGSGSLIVNDTLSGISGGSLSASNHYVGDHGTGLFTQSGGTNASAVLFLGDYAGDTGTYNLTGGLLTASWQYIGWNEGSMGTFNQSGGTNSCAGIIFDFHGGGGTYNLSGGLLAASSEEEAGDGLIQVTFNQSGGTNTTAELMVENGALHPERHQPVVRRLGDLLRQRHHHANRRHQYCLPGSRHGHPVRRRNLQPQRRTPQHIQNRRRRRHRLLQLRRRHAPGQQFLHRQLPHDPDRQRRRRYLRYRRLQRDTGRLAVRSGWPDEDQRRHFGPGRLQYLPRQHADQRRRRATGPRPGIGKQHGRRQR